MGRILTYLVLLGLSLVSISFAVSNRQMTTIFLWPLPFTIEQSIYVFILTSIVFGFLFGYLFSWFSFHNSRRLIKAQKVEINNLQSQLSEGSSQTNNSYD